MGSILGVYGMIVSVILIKQIDLNNYTWHKGYWHLASGLACGCSSLVAGYTIGEVGDIAVRKIMK